MRDKIILAAIAILCITLIEIFALYMGHDGQLLLTIVAAIAAIASGVVGYEIKAKR